MKIIQLNKMEIGLSLLFIIRTRKKQNQYKEEK